MVTEGFAGTVAGAVYVAVIAVVFNVPDPLAGLNVQLTPRPEW